MTSSICSSVSTGTEGTLIDTRDNNVYFVGKMLDGKCWMLQNLALDLTTAGLTTSTTNISSNWNSSSNRPPKATEQTMTKTSNTSDQQSWNFGKWVLATPLLTTNCGNNTAGQSISSCTKVGFVNVSSTTSFKPTYTATTRSWDGANSNSSTLVAVNCTSWNGSGTSKTCTAGTYDAHYLVGNYYQWYTATAGGTGSICPKGWQLPTAASAVAVGSFGGLLKNYKVSSSVSGTVDGVTYNIASSPLRFVRGGDVVPGSGYVNGSGQNGFYWSSTSLGRLYFTATAVEPTTGNFGGAYYGHSVRCIAE